MTSPAFSLEALKPLAGRVLQEALNRALQMDPDSLDRLEALNGRRIEAHLQAPDISLALDVRDGRILVGPVRTDSEPDISLKSTLSGVLQSLPMFAQGRTAVGAMRISGDIELARLLQELMKSYNPDWHAPFERAFGPIVGPQLARAVQEGLRHARMSAVNLAQSSAEYATEEARVVVSKAELADFHAEVDGLRQRGDRLQARVKRLQDQL